MAETLPPPSGRPFVVGANHRSSSLMLRDRLYVEDKAVPDYLGRLRDAGVPQALILSTCDRVEVQAVIPPEQEEALIPEIRKIMAAHAELDGPDLDAQTYVLNGEAAVKHIFSVTASLDSLMIGEPQVLGQVKDAYGLAKDNGMLAGDLDAVFQAAFASAKRVRSETEIGKRPVSIAAVAVQVARDVHGDLEDCKGLLVGAGDMGELVAGDLLAAGLGHLTVMHPFEARAAALSRSLDCDLASFDQLEDLLAEADIVLTSMGRRRQTISTAMVESAIKRRRHKPMFLVDTGIPGDIEPSVNDLDDAFFYDLNDLEKVAMEGRATREAEALAAWKIVDEELKGFLKGRAQRAAVPTLVKLREHFEAVRAQALEDAAGDAEKATHLVINRLLHEPSEALRDIAGRKGTGKVELEAAEKVLSEVFSLGKGK